MNRFALPMICVLTISLFSGCSLFSNKLTVTYDANGATSGTVPIDGKLYAPGEIVAVLGNPGLLAQNGIAFDGWNTQADGQGILYPGGSAFAIGSSNIILYAHWEYYIRGRGPAGGWVFYDKGSYSSGWRYMEAAPSDYSTGAAWSLNKTSVGITSTSIGTGQANTTTICSSQGSGTYAAQVCNDLTLN